MKKTYRIIGLDCAVCADKIERKLAAAAEFSSVSLDFAAARLCAGLAEGVSEAAAHKKILAVVKAAEPSAILHDAERENETVRGAVFTVGNLVKLIGAALFVAAFTLTIIIESGGITLPVSGRAEEIIMASVFAVILVMTAHGVIYRFFTNILRLRFFDENFLMMLAAVVAFILGEYPEGAAIMVFYQIGEFFQGLAVARSRAAIKELLAKRDADGADAQAAHTAHRKARTEQLITKFSRVYTPAMVGAAAVIAVIVPLFPHARQFDFGYFTHVALTFLIMSCPCALVLSIPMCCFGGVGAAARRGVLFKGANYLEALAKFDNVIFYGKLPTAAETAKALKALGVKRAVLVADGGAGDGVFDEVTAAPIIDTVARYKAAGRTVLVTAGKCAEYGADVVISADAGTADADVVLTEDAPEKIAAAVLLARRMNKLVAINIVMVMTLKAAMIALSFFYKSLLLAELADAGAAVIAVLIARTILYYKTP